MSSRWFSSPDIVVRSLDAESVDQATANIERTRPIVACKVVKILRPARTTSGNKQ